MSGRRALIVASGEYEHDGLRRLLSPAADADALADVLGQPGIGGFEVEVVRDQPAHDVQAKIEDLFSEARPDDVLLLHFSGHGLKSEAGELFFAARNTKPNRLASTAVSADFVQRCMRTSRSRSIVLFLDCCYGGAFGQGVAVRAGGDVNLVDSFPTGRLGGGRGRAVISASNAMEYAFEGDALTEGADITPSLFTAAVVRGLSTGEADRDRDGWVSLNELYDYVFDQVREASPNQTPSRDIEMQGELYLARSTRRRIEPVAVPAELRAAATDANMFSRTGAVAELRSRLLGENPAAALGARELLAEIAAEDIEFVAQKAAAALAEVDSSALDSRALDPGPSDPGVPEEVLEQVPETVSPAPGPPPKTRLRWGVPSVSDRARGRIAFGSSGVAAAGFPIFLWLAFEHWFDDGWTVVNLEWSNELNATFLPNWWLVLGVLGAAEIGLLTRWRAVTMGLFGGAAFSATWLGIYSAHAPSDIRWAGWVYLGVASVLLAAVLLWFRLVAGGPPTHENRRSRTLAGGAVIVLSQIAQASPDLLSILYGLSVVALAATVVVPDRISESRRRAALAAVTALAVIDLGTATNYLVRLSDEGAEIYDSLGRISLTVVTAAGLWIALSRPKDQNGSPPGP